MLISSSQIRAGRALLNWSQDDLAKATNIARPTIVNIEAGHQMPNSGTIQKMLNVFEQENILFTAHDGVRKKSNFVRVYRGVEQGMVFFNNVLLEHAQETLKPIYASNIDPDYFEDSLPGFYESKYFKGMKKIGRKIDFRITNCEGDYRRPNKVYARHRWIPKHKFNAITPFYVFADYLAIIMLLDEPIIFLIKDAKSAESYKEKFLLQWNVAIDF